VLVELLFVLVGGVLVGVAIATAMNGWLRRLAKPDRRPELTPTQVIRRSSTVSGSCWHITNGSPIGKVLAAELNEGW